MQLLFWNKLFIIQQEVQGVTIGVRKVLTHEGKEGFLSVTILKPALLWIVMSKCWY